MMASATPLPTSSAMPVGIFVTVNVSVAVHPVHPASATVKVTATMFGVEVMSTAKLAVTVPTESIRQLVPANTSAPVVVS